MTLQERISAQFKINAPMTMRQIIEEELRLRANSKQYHLMLKGLSYYEEEHDILRKKRMVINDAGKLVPSHNLANNRVVHPFARELTDQKVEYLLGLEYAISSEKSEESPEGEDENVTALTEQLGEDFQDTLRRVATDAITCGIGWIHVGYSEEGKFFAQYAPSVDIVPLWKDDLHKELDAVIRTYEIDRYAAAQLERVKKVEVWTLDGVRYHELHGSSLLPDPDVVELNEGMAFTTDEEGTPMRAHYLKGSAGANWDRIPFLAVKYNAAEIPLIKGVKHLIDEYDRTVSFDADMLEDQPNNILVIRNYTGEKAGDVRHNINQYRTVLVSDDGGVEQISVNIDVTASNAHLERIRRDIYSFGGGVDMRGDRIGASASGVALQHEFAGIDLDVNKLERGVQEGIRGVLYFAGDAAGKDYSDISFVFNRDIITVEKEAVEMCQASQGIISTETIVANHPWIRNVKAELKRMEEEKAREMKEYGAGYEMNGGGDAEPGVLGRESQKAGRGGAPQGGGNERRAG